MCGLLLCATNFLKINSGNSVHSVNGVGNSVIETCWPKLRISQICSAQRRDVESADKVFERGADVAIGGIHGSGRFTGA